jgi:phospholipase C
MKIHESRHSHKSKTTASALATAVVLAAQLAAQAASPELQAQTLSPAFKNFPAALKSKIQYVIVLYPENRSFDSLYGSFPGANGLANAGFGAESQYGKSNSTVLPSLPLPNMNGISLIGNNNADPRFASVFGSTMPNQDVDVSTAVPDVYCHGDLTHLFYLEQYQINNRSYGVGLDPKNAGGPLMSKFTEWSSNPGMVLSHYDEQNGGEGSLAKQYVLGDNCSIPRLAARFSIING